MAETGRIGPFVVEGELGRGAMGVVYRAFDPEGQRHVAIKVSSGAASDERAARLQREAELVARLRHPGIVGIHSAGALEDGRRYLVYELVEGARSLQEAWQGAGWRERAGRVLEVARAVAHAHAHGVMHRDLKPENVLVDAQGHLRVTDFGLGAGADLERMTRSQAAVGTPHYMAPEAFRGKPPTPAHDVWGLGVLLYEACAGTAPFDAPTFQELVNAVHAPPRPLRELAPGLPAGLYAVCARALTLDPQERYPEAGALAEDLARALRGERAARRLSRRAVTLGAAALALAAGVAALGAWKASRRAGSAAASEAAEGRAVLVQDLLGWAPPPRPEALAAARAELAALPASAARRALAAELAVAEALRALPEEGAEAAAARLRPHAAEPLAAVLLASLDDPRVAAYEPYLEASDPRARLAARVLTARLRRSQDPAAAAALLEPLRGPRLAQERAELALFAALGRGDPAALARLVRDARLAAALPAAQRAVDARMARVARAAESPLALRDGLRPLLALRAPLTGEQRWSPSSGVDATLERLDALLVVIETRGEALRQLDPAQDLGSAVGVLEDLAGARLAPARRALGELAADRIRAMGGTPELERLRARALVALLELGVDLSFAHIHMLTRDAVTGSGVAATYLRTWTHLGHSLLPGPLRTVPLDAEQTEEHRRRLGRLAEEEGLAPAARARALMLSTPLPDLPRCRQALALDPASPWLHLRLLSALLRAGQQGEAMLAAQRCFEAAEALHLRARFPTLTYEVGGLYAVIATARMRAGAKPEAEELAALLRETVVAPYRDHESSRLARAAHFLDRQLEAVLAGKEHPFQPDR
ncbi:MAG: protein kinase [Planctomycetota bacterium]